MKSVWRKAAELVDREIGCGCCYAIKQSIPSAYTKYPDGYGDVPEIQRFANVFEPKAPECGVWWWAFGAGGAGPRVIALLLMELIERDGGL